MLRDIPTRPCRRPDLKGNPSISSFRWPSSTGKPPTLKLHKHVSVALAPAARSFLIVDNPRSLAVVLLSPRPLPRLRARLYHFPPSPLSAYIACAFPSPLTYWTRQVIFADTPPLIFPRLFLRPELLLVPPVRFHPNFIIRAEPALI